MKAREDRSGEVSTIKLRSPASWESWPGFVYLNPLWESWQEVSIGAIPSKATINIL
jgi:hypothetical protein